MMHRKKGQRVPPASQKSIRATANSVRKLLRIGDIRADMLKIMEFVLPIMIEDYSFEVLEPSEMNYDEARTFPDKYLIQVRSDVYEALCNGDPRAQFTMAHELGHLVMHSGISELHFARNRVATNHKVFEDSEWQADTFASEFLMPYDLALKCNSVDEIKEMFGVSNLAAEYRFKKIRE